MGLSSLFLMIIPLMGDCGVLHVVAGGGDGDDCVGVSVVPIWLCLLSLGVCMLWYWLWGVCLFVGL